MATLSEENIAEFQRLYKKSYNTDLCREEAIDKATQLLRLVRAVYMPTFEEMAKEHDELATGEN